MGKISEEQAREWLSSWIRQDECTKTKFIKQDIEARVKLGIEMGLIAPDNQCDECGQSIKIYKQKIEKRCCFNCVLNGFAVGCGFMYAECKKDNGHKKFKPRKKNV